MTSRRYLMRGVCALAVLAAASIAPAATQPIYYPYSHGAARLDPNRPLGRIGHFEPPFVAKKPTTSGTWADVSAALPFSKGPWNPVQLTDGSVIIQDYCTSKWYKLTPDSKGNYANGSWSAIAAMPSGYQPLFFASQILPNGQLIVNGGEYEHCEDAWTNLGAMYDPVANSWTPVAPPAGWAMIGDAESIILPDGSYMLADCCDAPAQQAIGKLVAGVMTWTVSNAYTCPTGDFCNDEQAYTPLPGGNVFMVDVWNIGSNFDDYEVYNTAAGTWSLAGQTPDLLTTTQYRELGPAALTPKYGSQGTIIQFSAEPTGGVNDVYDVASGTWKSGPVLTYNGTVYNCSDAPAATLPDGNILVQASPGTFSTPSHFWEVAIGRVGNVVPVQVSDPAQAPNTSNFESNLLVLPTGQVLWDNSQAVPNEVAIYSPNGVPKSAWRPAIASVASSLALGSTGNAISGTNFNGFDLGGVYGDDAQASTNFPLVRITNAATGDVCYARSYNFSTMGVWTTGTSNAVFDVPAGCETGRSRLQVVVNGIASAAVRVNLHS